MLKETVDCTFSRTGLRGRIVGEVTLKLAAAYAHSPMPCEVEFSLTRRGGGIFREVQCNPRSAEVVGGGTKRTNVPHANIRCRMSLDSTAPILALKYTIDDLGADEMPLYLALDTSAHELGGSVSIR
jgi:hypothetical protein